MKIQVYFAEQNSTIPKFDQKADIFLVIGNGNQLKFKKDSRPIIYLPSTHDYYGEDIMVEPQKIARLKPLVDVGVNVLERGVYQAKGMRILSAIYWPSSMMLKQEIVSLGLANSRKYKEINAEGWFSDIKNLQFFYQINEKLMGYPLYKQIMQTGYGPGKFHPIVSYAIGQQTTNWLRGELAKPFYGKTIILLRYAPFSYSLLKYNYYPWPAKKLDFLSILNKTQNDRAFYNFLSGHRTEIIASKSNLCLHLGSGPIVNYRINYTNVVAGLNKNVIIPMDDEKNELYSIQNTLYDIYYNSQLFTKLLQEAMLNPSEIIRDSEDYLQMSKFYNFNLLPIYGEYFKNLEAIDSQNIRQIDDKEVGLTPDERTSGKINPSLQHYRLKAFNNIVQENDRLIKKWYDYFNE